MNKVTRMLMMTGMALAASATISAGAATAASAAPATPSGDASVAKNTPRWGGKTRVIGYYHNAITCHRVGNLGEFRNRWDDHDCYRVRGHFGRNWVLVAKWDRHGFPGGHHGGHGGHGFPGGGHGPGFPGGGHGPGFPGNGPWDQKNR
jgi:hypothetical protein